jgi:hypothetical protein
MGWQWQEAGRRVRRADVRELKRGRMIQRCPGLVGWLTFTAFVQRERLGRRLARDFGHLKVGKRVVYPMHGQMQLLTDAAVVGAPRVFDFEWLATDLIFEHLAGGAVPSVDTLYDDLRRLGPEDPAIVAFDSSSARIRAPLLPWTGRTSIQTALECEMVERTDAGRLTMSGSP